MVKSNESKEISNISREMVTVGIPFYCKTNESQLIESIDSILNQSLLPSEIHLIQDGDIPSNLKKIITHYKIKYPSLIKHLRPQKKGLPNTLNFSLQNCSSKYYARMDSDDISFSERLCKQVDFMEKNNDVDILGSWSIEFETSIHEKNTFINRKPNKSKLISDFFHYKNPLIHPSVVFRMDVFSKIGYYDSSYYDGHNGCIEDLEFWGRALRKNIIINNLQEPLIYFRTKGIQLRRSKITSIKRQIRARYSYNTFSIKLNILKISSIIFRLLPRFVRIWAYKKLR